MREHERTVFTRSNICNADQSASGSGNRLKDFLFLIFALCGIFGGLLLIVWYYLAAPTFGQNQRSTAQVEATRLRSHVELLSKKLSPRSAAHPETLLQCASYIRKHFAQAGAFTEMQPFTVNGKQYANVIGRFGRQHTRTVVIGAHYDAASGTPGADDNASGVAGLIELAYLIGKQNPDVGIELVAFTLEEPPYFSTNKMGSVFHAASISRRQDIVGVIVLEMIGYFNDAPGSQSYPLPVFKLFYPDTGNFITIIGRLDQRSFTQQIKHAMKGATDLPVFSINAPSGVRGVDFSDHRSYWEHELNAVMITDTAFLRNRSYHKPEDVAEKLDYHRMGQVVIGIFEAIKKL